MELSTRSRALLAIDPSLTASGWALFCLSSGMPLAYGVIAPPGPGVTLAHRLDSLQASVSELLRQLKLGNGDILICEGPAPLVQNPNSALKVERVRGIFESVARAMALTVPGRINPRTVQAEILGMRGKQMARTEVKAWARETASRLYGKSLGGLPCSGIRHTDRPLPQDVIDALLIGTLAVAKVELSRKSNLDLVEIFESRKSRSNNGSRSLRGWSEADVQKLVERK